MELDDFKLKHLHLLTTERIDYMYLLKDMIGYKHTRFNKIFKFKKKFNQLYTLIKIMQAIEPKKLIYNTDKGLKKPDSIDNITFIAMMELTMLFTSTDISGMAVNELIAKAISIACFSENMVGDFDIDSYAHERFYNRVMNEPAYKMIGLYNWIEKSCKESGDMWTKLFFAVDTTDRDYLQAGGNRMEAFNVVNSVKGICRDFNLSYKEAWQMQYAVTQTNALANATSGHIQQEMTKIKEARMKAQQKKVS